ncbi:hypothetical protein M514_28215 [Trichuris suis]|uniref:Uncharacterized protein n=1 Tax=Trichuris suis TaxID=68888 RepID=A0A085MQW0_9BILA|nr:hypothetical protein M514_28215 [Trichuris suis]
MTHFRVVKTAFRYVSSSFGTLPDFKLPLFALTGSFRYSFPIEFSEQVGRFTFHRYRSFLRSSFWGAFALSSASLTVNRLVVCLSVTTAVVKETRSGHRRSICSLCKRASANGGPVYVTIIDHLARGLAELGAFFHRLLQKMVAIFGCTRDGNPS